jgi:hypothetical protein
MVMRVIAALDVTVVLTRPALAASTVDAEASEAFDLDKHLSGYDR